MPRAKHHLIKPLSMLRSMLPFAIAATVFISGTTAAQIATGSSPSRIDAMRSESIASPDSLPILPDSVRQIVDEMAACGVYEMSFYVGYFGSLSKQYERLNQLKRLLLKQELVSLAALHPSGVVRLYAFQALKRAAGGVSLKLLQQFESDSTVVTTLFGCTGSRHTISTLAGENLNWYTQQGFQIRGSGLFPKKE